MGKLDIFLSQVEYIRSLMARTSGLKVLILDSETTGMISLIYSQTQILEREVFLVERIDSASRVPVRHLKAILLLRPTPQNFHKLCEELKHPLYSEYHLFFTNLVPQTDLEALARNDEFELVQEVHEIFTDIYALNHNLFSLNIDTCATMIHDQHSWSHFNQQHFNRMIDGVFSVLCSLRIKPTIRYQKSSSICSRLAKQILTKLHDESALFEENGGLSYSIHATNSIEDSAYPSRHTKDAVLILVDRREDPITPLLNQWTYQAMLHELIGIENNRLNISIPPDINEPPKQIVMSPFNDSFYQENYMANFGQLGISIKQLLEEYQQQKKKSSKIDSVEDIQKFLEIFPDYQKMTGNVSKHVETVHILSKLVYERNLLEVSLLEQDLVCHNNMQEHLNQILEKFNSPSTPQFELLRLSLLFALRYEHDISTNKLKQAMIKRGFEPKQILLIDQLLAYAGAAQRNNDLFKTKNILDIAKTTIQRTLQGTSNVLTQHQPYLTSLIDSIYKGKLKESQFPLLSTSASQISAKEKSTNIIVFIIGGATYEEAKMISEFSSSNNCQIILGGTTILNSRSFLADIGNIPKFSREPQKT